MRQWARIALAAAVMLGTANRAALGEDDHEEAAAWPGIAVDRAAGTVALDAKVAQREGDWLELLACTPHSREYESILTVSAKPSHVHLALLTLGLEAGHPLRSHFDEKTQAIQSEPAIGPWVEVALRYERQGHVVEESPTQWVKNQQTGAALPDGRWMFTGSRFVAVEERSIYLADLNGSVLTLVNFGDDLLARTTDATNQTDDATWGANTQAIPPVGTAVTIVLRAVRE